MATLGLSAPEHLGATVVLGYCDIAAAGIRVLEGLSPASDETQGLRETGRESLTFSGMGLAVFDGLPPLEVVHFNVNDGDKSVTFLKLNTAVGEDLTASLALSIVDLLTVHRPTLERVIVAAAVQPPKRQQIPARPTTAPSSTTATATAAAAASAVIPPDAVCRFSCAGCPSEGGASSLPSLPPSVSSLPALPPGARIADSFLTNLVRLSRLEELPLLVLARLGYRATGAAADVDGTDEAINDLGQCLAQVVGLEFSAEKACGARRSKGWKGSAPARGVVPGYI